MVSLLPGMGGRNHADVDHETDIAFALPTAPRKGTGAILVSNHTSSIDPAAVAGSIQPEADPLDDGQGIFRF